MVDIDCPGCVCRFNVDVTLENGSMLESSPFARAPNPQPTRDRSQGYGTPTPVQKYSIPAVLEGQGRLGVPMLTWFQEGSNNMQVGCWQKGGCRANVTWCADCPHPEATLSLGLPDVRTHIQHDREQPLPIRAIPAIASEQRATYYQDVLWHWVCSLVTKV